VAAGRAGDGSLAEVGSVSIEVAILAPFLLVILVALTLYGGRRVTAGNDVRSAAHAGARAATLEATPAGAEAAARAVVATNLAAAGVRCAGGPEVAVDLGQFQPGGQVTVTVTCTADLSDLAALGVADTATLNATAVEVVDRFRSGSTGTG
jgi:Flp pilus assembly protein TadG